MGGDGNSHFLSDADDSEESPLLGQDFSVRSPASPIPSGNPLGAEGDCESGLGVEGFDKSEANLKRAHNIYMEVLRSYDELQDQAVALESAKRKILGYTPGSWTEAVGGTDLWDYKVPKMTTILLIGTKGSGKSSLVNKISDVFESERFTPQRAQVSCGTIFAHEYKIPKYAKSFCVYDTRSLFDNQFDNENLVKRWLTNGVRHGELVMRASDDVVGLKTRLKRSNAQHEYYPNVARPVNFVVFVVNAVSVLESMEGKDEAKKCDTQVVSETFNSPLLSFKDDKPVVVVTHGDLLSVPERVRVRVYLGELLGIHPKKQIFDIPESNDCATKLEILDMLHYCLDHADKNLPFKGFWSSMFVPLLMLIVMLVTLYKLYW